MLTVQLDDNGYLKVIFVVPLPCLRPTHYITQLYPGSSTAKTRYALPTYLRSPNIAAFGNRFTETATPPSYFYHLVALNHETRGHGYD